MRKVAAVEAEGWELRLILLGIGGAFDADLGIANTGALLEVREAGRVSSRLLIDCGHTCGRQLHRLGLCYDDVDAVLLTHAHGDHMDGLEIFGYRQRFLHGTRGRVLADGAVLANAWGSLRAKMGRLKIAPLESRPARIDDYFDAEPVCPEGVRVAGGRLHVGFFPVPHIPGDPACGLRIELDPDRGDGPVIRWSGDTTFHDPSPLFDDLRPERGDLVFHECKFEPHYDTTVHTHVEELQKLPEEVRSVTVLMHHGKLEASPARIDGMVLGQPYQRFDFPR